MTKEEILNRIRSSLIINSLDTIQITVRYYSSKGETLEGPLIKISNKNIISDPTIFSLDDIMNERNRCVEELAKFIIQTKKEI